MSHPFTSPEAKGLRERVNSFVLKGLHRTTASNIIFVCGGDGEEHLRPKFINYMVGHMTAYTPFRPEAAQKDYMEQDQADTLNLSAFEELVSDLSLGIVLFAESPGSYAETGLFSALEHARKKTLVVMNADLQGKGSFLSFGPVPVIAAASRLGAAIQLDYANPNFKLIRDRLEDRIPLVTNFRSIGAKAFSELQPIELMSLIWFFVDLLRVSSFDDLVFSFRSLFDAHASPNKIKQILSVLVGAGLVTREGPLGLVKISDSPIRLAEASATKKNFLDTLRIDVTNLLEGDCDPNYVEAIANAH